MPVNTVVMGIAGSRRCSKRAGWKVGKDRVERIWRRGGGLKVPQKQKPRGRLWLNDGSCVRLRPTHRNHVWSYDFVSARTHDGRSVRLLNLIDEHTRESSCWCVRNADGHRPGVISALADVMGDEGSISGTSSLGQWAGVRRQRLYMELAGQHREQRRCTSSLQLSVGEWLLRELQL